ncbi:NTP pyrophosphohydrolase [Saccharothrix sp. Mg75]|uniref:NTP pyrophosphohydrolase n=1 Tax=Saccharothrix sp. Mg75 TaxID=3445357 RepID=UPI003EEBA42C
MTLPLLVVDAANVVGSVPDGWWKDRAAAATRLRDDLVAVAERGLPSHPGPLEVVLVVEGRARHVGSTPGVRVVPATADGDDKIVEVVRDEGAGRPVTVATADRALRRRVEALGATVVGPRSVRGH